MFRTPSNEQSAPNRPIQWIAGLLSLLVVLASGIPVHAEPLAEPQIESAFDAPCAGAGIADPALLTTAATCASRYALLGAESNVESEIEELDADASAPSSLTPPVACLAARDDVHGSEHDHRSRVIAGRLAPRAPPSV